MSDFLTPELQMSEERCKTWESFTSNMISFLQKTIQFSNMVLFSVWNQIVGKSWTWRAGLNGDLQIGQFAGLAKNVVDVLRKNHRIYIFLFCWSLISNIVGIHIKTFNTASSLQFLSVISTLHMQNNWPEDLCQAWKFLEMVLTSSTTEKQPDQIARCSCGL